MPFVPYFPQFCYLRNCVSRERLRNPCSFECTFLYNSFNFLQSIDTLQRTAVFCSRCTVKRKRSSFITALHFDDHFAPLFQTSYNFAIKFDKIMTLFLPLFRFRHQIFAAMRMHCYEILNLFIEWQIWKYCSLWIFTFDLFFNIRTLLKILRY